ncbi:MAG: T9SS C-terminal target domain-containing protein, partial [Bacteroidetes bacterium]
INEKQDACSRGYNGLIKTVENELADHYDVTFTRLEIFSENTSSFIETTAYIEAKVVADSMTTFSIGLSSQMSIDQMLYEGTAVAFTHENDAIQFDLETPKYQGEAFHLTIDYEGNGYDGDNYAGGLHFTTSDPDFNYEDHSYTFNQPYGSDVWFPCKQVLSDKIDSLDIWVTTNASQRVSANGLLVEQVDMDNGTTQYKWQTRHPIAYYLVAFNIFSYSEYNFYCHPEGFDESIFVQNFLVDEEHIELMGEELDLTCEAMNLYSNWFGKYPFHDEKYGHSIWGKGFGMEHQTITSMPYDIDFRRLSHELSHQWFGNMVTCGTWLDIWLNEGFATYFDYLALKHIISDQVGEDRMAYYHERAMVFPNGSIYVPAPAINNASRIFNYKLSYCKAAAVIRMLRFELQNDDLFWEILTNYLEQFKNGTATTEDFISVVNQTTGEDYHWFFDQWIYGEGYPIYSGNWYQDQDTLYLEVTQEVSYPAVTPFYNMLMQYEIRYPGGDTTVYLQQEQPTQLFKIPFEEYVTNINIDPENETLNQDEGIIEIPVGSTTNMELQGVKVYPNPFEEKVKVSLPSEYSGSFEFSLFDNRGILVKSGQYNVQDITLDTKSLAPGLYIIKVQNETGRSIHRIVKME